MKIQNRERLIRKLKSIPQAVRDELTKALDKSGAEMSDLAQRFAPVDSGALKASIGYQFGDYAADNANVRGVNSGGGGHDLAVTVHAGSKDAWYAALVEFGTSAHEITAKNAAVLTDGVKVYGRKVKHPGSNAQPFFFPAYRLTKKRSKSRLKRAMAAGCKKAVQG